MNEYVKEYMETGKDLNTICNDKIKANNRQWLLIFILTSVIWIGYICILHKRYEDTSQLRHEKLVSDSIIENLENRLDSAVYFKDIIVK